MQALRDAFTLLVLVLVVATVRVSPVPDFELSPAQASGPTHAVSGVQAQPNGAVASPAVAEPAQPAGPDVTDDEKACPETLAVKSHSHDVPGRPVPPCNV